jgi:hypothetical protein
MARATNMTLDRLEVLPIEDLRTEWARRYGDPVPNLSEELLRLGVGYRMQEQRSGGVSRATRSLLRQMAVSPASSPDKALPPRKLTPGTRLVRDWHGVGHTVTVLDDGFEFDGLRWKSLSAIAKAITGTHWNGPRFFGLSEAKR